MGGVHRIALRGFGRAFAHDAAPVQHHHTVGQIRGHDEVVFDDESRFLGVQNEAKHTHARGVSMCSGREKRREVELTV